jgi:hypothetical protein
MAYDDGFSRYNASERNLQPIAITSVDPESRIAVGTTRNRTTVQVNCAYATGDTITVPAVGEQWYCERFNGEWRLYGRIPFNDATLNIEPEEGQVSVGSARGPLELNGTEVRSNAPLLRLNGVYFRDSGDRLERSTDKVNWEPITAQSSVATGVLRVVSNAIAGRPATASIQDLLGALSTADAAAVESLRSFLSGWDTVGGHSLVNQLAEALTGGRTGLAGISAWAGALNPVWDNICNNTPFLNNLKLLGTGDTVIARVASGLQALIDDVWGFLVCGNPSGVTPQQVTALLSTIQSALASNPLVVGLVALFDEVGDETLSFLERAVRGLLEFYDQVVGALSCLFPSNSNAPLDIVQAIQATITAVTNNPYVRMLRAVADTTSNNLILQLLSGVTGVVDWFIEILKDLFPFIDWDKLKTVGFAGLMDGMATFDIGGIADVGGWINDGILVPIKDAVTGAFNQALTGPLGALNAFFANVKNGGFLDNIVDAMTGNSGNFLTGPLGDLARLFSGVTLVGNKSLLNQLSDRVNDLGDALGINSIVSSITGIDVADLVNSYHLEIKGSPTGGGYTLSYGSGNTTASIARNANAATIQAALSGLTGIGSVTVTPVTSATSTKFKVAIPNADHTLAVAASTLTGGTSPTVTVTQKFRGGLDALASFFANLGTFDGVNDLLTQILERAGSNVIPVVSAITGLSEAQLTQLFGTNPIQAVTTMFNNFRSLFTFTGSGGTSVFSLLPANGTFGPAEIAAAANAFFNNFLGLGNFFANLKRVFGTTIDFNAPVQAFTAATGTAASGLISFLNQATGGVLFNTSNLNINGAGGIASAVNPDAGSGGRMVRTATAQVSAGANGPNRVGSGFFNLVADVPGATSGITASTSGGSFTVTQPGWYMVELAYKVYANASWGWNMAPMLYLNGSPHKIGTDVMYTWSLAGSAGAQRYVQNTFIVHLAAGSAVQAGYHVYINPVALNRSILGATNNSGQETYFSIALLNKTFV